jgi:condensin complex subunit 2
MMMMDELDEEGVRKPFSTLNLDEEEEEEEGETLGMLPSVPTKKHNKKASQRRRRRSSARFLHLGASDDNNEDEKDEPVPETEQLGELYKRAIRMNAENRINAGNSWNIKLIENMDKVLEQNEESNQEGVNFTKASCTLDASVKIYSYRVDDVHLSSYKVLANLNRNDSQKNTTAGSNNANATQGEDGILNDDGEECDEDGPSQRRAGASVETLETNLGKSDLPCLGLLL